MKKMNSQPRVNGLKDYRNHNSETFGLGITNYLLEKYKPKGLCSIENMREGKGQRKED